MFNSNTDEEELFKKIVEDEATIGYHTPDPENAPDVTVPIEFGTSDAGIEMHSLSVEEAFIFGRLMGRMTIKEQKNIK
jgi:hypothetical protein